MSQPCPTCRGRGIIPDTKLCANETCGRFFSVQEGEPGKRDRYMGVIYCSQRCAKAQAQRQYRRRQRAS